MVLILLPSTPPASSMSCSASFMVETFEGPRYAAVPVSGNRPPATKVSSAAFAELSAVPVPHPDNVSTAVAAIAVAVVRHVFRLGLFI